MRTVLTVAFALCITSGYSQGFIEQYKFFWLHRLAKSVSPASSTLSNATSSAKVIDKVAAAARKKKIELVQNAIRAHDDFDQSDSVFVLLFINEKTSLERTYVWNNKVNFYFEEYVAIDSAGASQKLVEITDTPQHAQLVTHTLITKEDTLRSLLMLNQLGAMNRLAYTYRVDAGETCLALFCKKKAVDQYTLYCVDLPAFDYIGVRRK